VVEHSEAHLFERLTDDPFPAFGLVSIRPSLVATGDGYVLAYVKDYEEALNPSLAGKFAELFLTGATGNGKNRAPVRTLLEVNSIYENIGVTKMISDRCGNIFLFSQFWKTGWERGVYLWRSRDGGRNFEILGPLPGINSEHPLNWSSHFEKHPPCGRLIAAIRTDTPTNDYRLWTINTETLESDFYMFERYFPWQNTEVMGASAASSDSGRIFVAFTYLDIQSRRSQLVLFRSDDDGRTFPFQKRVVDDALYTPDLYGRLQVMATPDGQTVFILWRNFQGRDSTRRQAMLSVSRDGGETWEEPRQYNDLITMCLSDQGGVLHGSRLFFVWLNQCREPLYPFHSLWVPADLLARYSDDFGRTFSAIVKLNESRRFSRPNLEGVGSVQTLGYFTADAGADGLYVSWDETPFSIIGELPFGRRRFVGGAYLYLARWSP